MSTLSIGSLLVVFGCIVICYFWEKKQRFLLNVQVREYIRQFVTNYLDLCCKVCDGQFRVAFDFPKKYSDFDTFTIFEIKSNPVHFLAKISLYWGNEGLIKILFNLNSEPQKIYDSVYSIEEIVETISDRMTANIKK